VAILKRVSKRTGKTSWQVLVDRRDPVTGERNRVTVGTFRTKKEAQQEERRALEGVDRGTFVDPSKVTLSETIELWLKMKKQLVSGNTHYQYSSCYELHIKPVLGAVLVQKLTHDILQRQVTAWSDGGMGASLVRRCVSVIRQSLDGARKSRIVESNPIEDIERPSDKKKKDLVAWTPEQIATFLDTAKDDIYFPLWHLLALEGCRRSEALGLRWSDVDLESGSATIVQTVVPDAQNKGAAKTQPRTKTEAGARTIMLTPTTVEAIKAKKRVVEERQKASGTEWSDGDVIVTTSIGTQVNPSSVRRRLHGIIAASGLPTITAHDLRHIAATRMIAAGVPMAIVSHKLGHSTIGITMDLYSHLLPSDQSEAVRAMEALLILGREANAKVLKDALAALGVSDEISVELLEQLNN
jgi:integrase